MKRCPLTQLIDAMAPYLVDIRIRATVVEVEVRCGELTMRLARPIPEGEHDLAGAALRLLQDAAAQLNARPELAKRPLAIGAVP